MVTAAIATSRGSLLATPYMRIFCTNMMSTRRTISLSMTLPMVWANASSFGSTDHTSREAWVNHDLLFSDDEYDAYLMEVDEATWDAAEAMPVQSLHAHIGHAMVARVASPLGYGTRSVSQYNDSGHAGGITEWGTHIGPCATYTQSVSWRVRDRSCLVFVYIEAALATPSTRRRG